MSVCTVCSIELSNENKIKNRKKCKDCFNKFNTQRCRIWKLNNPEKHKTYSNKSHLKTTMCECGKLYHNHHIKRHNESKFHQKFEEDIGNIYDNIYENIISIKRDLYYGRYENDEDKLFMINKLIKNGIQINYAKNGEILPFTN